MDTDNSINRNVFQEQENKMDNEQGTNVALLSRIIRLEKQNQRLRIAGLIGFLASLVFGIIALQKTQSLTNWTSYLAKNAVIRGSLGEIATTKLLICDHLPYRYNDDKNNCMEISPNSIHFEDVLNQEFMSIGSAWIQMINYRTNSITTLTPSVLQLGSITIDSEMAGRILVKRK